MVSLFTFMLWKPSKIMEFYDLLIIGGGPAGVFSAINTKGKRKTAILEKGPQLLRKFLLSGSGQCNLTHKGNVSDFLGCYGKNGRFLKTALYKLGNAQLLKYFEERGSSFSCGTDGKYFPESLRAGELYGILTGELRNKGVDVFFNTPAQKIIKGSDCFRVYTPKGIFAAGKILIATGGASYPQTGSSGDGQVMAGELGHSIVPLKPALAPVFVKDHRLSVLAGNSFENISVSVWRDNKKAFEASGDLVIAHKGLSGPVILDNSRAMLKGDIIKINFSGINPDEFRNELSEAAKENPSLMIKTLLKSVELPKNLTEKLIALSGLDGEKRGGEISKKMLADLSGCFSQCPFEIGAVGGFDIAMATSGGVELGEIDHKTMASKIVDGLYFAGEVMDIDGDTGGYNLQAAFSTGFLAGESS